MKIGKFISQNLRPIRFLIATCVCALLVFSSAFPALATTSHKSDPTSAEAKMGDIERRSQEALKQDPRPLNEVTEASKGGLNAVQGDANKEKMKTPENSNATSVEEQLKEGLKKVFD